MKKRHNLRIHTRLMKLCVAQRLSNWKYLPFKRYSKLSDSFLLDWMVYVLYVQIKVRSKAHRDSELHKIDSVLTGKEITTTGLFKGFSHPHSSMLFCILYI